MGCLLCSQVSRKRLPKKVELEFPQKQGTRQGASPPLPCPPHSHTLLPVPMASDAEEENVAQIKKQRQAAAKRQSERKTTLVKKARAYCIIDSRSSVLLCITTGRSAPFCVVVGQASRLSASTLQQLGRLMEDLISTEESEEAVQRLQASMGKAQHLGNEGEARDWLQHCMQKGHITAAQMAACMQEWDQFNSNRQTARGRKGKGGGQARGGDKGSLDGEVEGPVPTAPQREPLAPLQQQTQQQQTEQQQTQT